MQKQKRFHHSVTENGKLQLRIVTEYIKDGEVIESKMSGPMTPADVTKMDGFDDVSKEIVSAITDKQVLADFKTESQKPTGKGIEEIVTHDRELHSDGKISVRRITRLYDDGKEVSKKYHRSWIMPGDTIQGDVISTALAKKIHTKKVKTAFKKQQKQ